jgi:dienelactone hydrolase
MGMNSRWIDIKAQDGGRFKGYLSLPHQVEKTGKGPGIVLIQEIFGGDHGFNCWDRPAYNQQSSALARGRTLAFLATTIS